MVSSNTEKTWHAIALSINSVFESYKISGRNTNKQESPADAVKPARRKSMPKLLQFDVFRFISPNFISPIANA